MRFLRDEEAATAIEYGVIAALLSLVIVTCVGNFADALAYLFGNTNSRVSAAFGSG